MLSLANDAKIAQVELYVGLRLGRRLGGVLELSWEIFGRPRRAQDGAKMGQDGAKTAQDGAKTEQVGAKTPQDAAKTLQDGAETVQDAPKTPPKRDFRSL